MKMTHSDPYTCHDVKFLNPNASSGMFDIDPIGDGNTISVYCDFSSDVGKFKIQFVLCISMFHFSLKISFYSVLTWNLVVMFRFVFLFTYSRYATVWQSSVITIHTQKPSLGNLRPCSSYETCVNIKEERNNQVQYKLVLFYYVDWWPESVWDGNANF